jgi:hypothetical protein
MKEAMADAVHEGYSTPAGCISAFPNPVLVFDYSEAGVTKLTWMSTGTEAVEVHVGVPDGPLLSRTGPNGAAETGKWVSEGMVFCLQDVTGGKPLSPENTLATIKVQVISCRCTTGLSGDFNEETGLCSNNRDSTARVLLAGWFSFERGGATAGDLISRDVVCGWLRSAGYSYDVALARPFRGGVDWRAVDPRDYSHVVFVCGPFHPSDLARSFLQRFQGRPLIGLNLSMINPLSEWNPFDTLLERDSTATSRADIVFHSSRPPVPVVGIVLVEPVPEYKERAMHEDVNRAILELIRSREMAVVEIDTRLETNVTDLRTAAEIESLVARMDVVVTTRLHGVVLALKNGVPALAVDPHAGGSKVKRQAETIGWPVAFAADAISPRTLSEALDYCLTPDARKQAAECARRARTMVEDVRRHFLVAVSRHRT